MEGVNETMDACTVDIIFKFDVDFFLGKKGLSSIFCSCTVIKPHSQNLERTSSKS